MTNETFQEKKLRKQIEADDRARMQRQDQRATAGTMAPTPKQGKDNARKKNNMDC